MHQTLVVKGRGRTQTLQACSWMRRQMMQQSQMRATCSSRLLALQTQAQRQTLQVQPAAEAAANSTVAHSQLPEPAVLSKGLQADSAAPAQPAGKLRALIIEQ